MNIKKQTKFKMKLSYRDPKQEFDVLETDLFYRSLDPQLSSNWHQLRYGRITGTIVGELMAHKEPEKCRDLIFERQKRTFSEYAQYCMNYGVQMEPKARDFLAKLLGADIEEWGIIISKSELRFGASLDGYIPAKQVSIEIKCPQSINPTYDRILELLEQDYDKQQILRDLMPYNYYNQVQWGLFISGLPKCIFFVFCPNEERFVMIEIESCPEYIKEMETKAKEFIANYL